MAPVFSPARDKEVLLDVFHSRNLVASCEVHVVCSRAADHLWTRDFAERERERGSHFGSRALPQQ